MISVKLTNESSYDLIYNSVARDTLNAKLQKPKTSGPLKIPMARIKEVEVEKMNLPLTLAATAVFIGGSFLIVSHQFNNY